MRLHSRELAVIGSGPFRGGFLRSLGDGSSRRRRRPPRSRRRFALRLFEPSPKCRGMHSLLAPDANPFGEEWPSPKIELAAERSYKFYSSVNVRRISLDGALRPRYMDFTASVGLESSIPPNLARLGGSPVFAVRIMGSQRLLAAGQHPHRGDRQLERRLVRRLPCRASAKLSRATVRGRVAETCIGSAAWPFSMRRSLEAARLS